MLKNQNLYPCAKLCSLLIDFWRESFQIHVVSGSGLKISPRIEKGISLSSIFHSKVWRNEDNSKCILHFVFAEPPYVSMGPKSFSKWRPSWPPTENLKVDPWVKTLIQPYYNKKKKNKHRSNHLLLSALLHHQHDFLQILGIILRHIFGTWKDNIIHTLQTVFLN